MSEWRPIETAPRDGTPILVWARWMWSDILDGEASEYMAMVATIDEYPGIYALSHHPYADEAVDATHWMPLPEPPRD